MSHIQSFPLSAITTYSLQPDHDSYSIPRKPLPESSRGKGLAVMGEQEYSGPRRKRSLLARQTLLQIWWLELLCCMLSLTMLSGLAIMLRTNEFQPLRRFPYNLSINTVTAIFANVIKTCCLVILAEGLGQLKWKHFLSARPVEHMSRYDMATRGPWGCVMLITSLRFQHFLPVLGAIVSILTVVVDPFVQQLVAYYPCNVGLTNGTSVYVPRANIYLERGSQSSSGYWSITRGLENTIYNGLFANSKLEIAAQCPTGNCSYPISHTLAYCSSCIDATKELSIAITNNTSAGRYNYTTSLPSGLNASTAFLYVAGPQTTMFTMAATNDNPGNYRCEYAQCVTNFEFILPGGSLQGNSSTPELQVWSEKYGQDLGPAVKPCQYSWQQNKWGCNGFGAARCSLRPCVQELHTDIKFGVFEQKIVRTYHDWGIAEDGDNRDSALVMLDTECIGPDGRKAMQQLGYNMAGSRFMPFNSSVNGTTGHFYETPGKDIPPSSISPSCIYQFHSAISSATDRMFRDTFTTSIHPKIDFIPEGTTTAFRFYNNTYVNRDSIAGIFDNIAQAMTIRIRQSSANGIAHLNEPLKGSIEVAETCMAVRWPWIVYPAAISMFTTFFLAMVIISSEMDQAAEVVRGWKSSLLPLIYHRLDGEIRDNKFSGSSESLAGIATMQQAAKHDIASIKPAASI